ncbi:MAG TPA: thrombospondin, partial [Pilimelia sp.]|nr:thrombospondin [Pilimelia sp.]
LGVAAILMVLTGVLAGYGIALGVVGLFLSIGGISATGRRHVAGKSDAVLGAGLSVAAMVIGALAMTGSLSWLSTETDNVQQVRQWLDTQLANRV